MAAKFSSGGNEPPSSGSPVAYCAQSNAFSPPPHLPAAPACSLLQANAAGRPLYVQPDHPFPSFWLRFSNIQA